ncbi:SGNH/GDSL hydrolase family protein [Nocardia sp. CNY236]|uniref:SGNH/GDSL hydrolase family protein n=1 Tax=Nocardia sp. CNY236 TaxID=1169152 RepID=UPI0004203CA2|nr:SGNH/GDSL hydrolase family protein [Nocardia sp. CNY236]
MSTNTRTRYFSSWIVAVMATVAAAIGVPQATATPTQVHPEGSKLVVLGDSFAANGFRFWADAEECLHGPTSWPTQLSELMGVSGTADFRDESCSGAAINATVGYSLVREAINADKAGAFGPRTELVAVQIGLNDSWGDLHNTTLWGSLLPCVFNLTDGCGLEAAEQGRLTDFRGVSGAHYAERIREVVQYIRYYAPQARIVLVGYPEFFPPQKDSVCVTVLGVGAYVQPRGEGLIAYFDRIDAAQREAAALLDIEFFDTRRSTRGHGLCTDDPWLNGLVDPRADAFGIPFHPSAHGDSVVAQGLYERFGR